VAREPDRVPDHLLPATLGETGPDRHSGLAQPPDELGLVLVVDRRLPDHPRQAGPVGFGGAVPPGPFDLGPRQAGQPEDFRPTTVVSPYSCSISAAKADIFT